MVADTAAFMDFRPVVHGRMPVVPS